MNASKEMRERAKVFAEGYTKVGAVMLDSALVAFAAAEISRAVQECIEAQCRACRRGFDLRPRDPSVGSFHRLHDDGSNCKAIAIHELLYQKQLASEGEEK